MTRRKPSPPSPVTTESGRRIQAAKRQFDSGTPACWTWSRPTAQDREAIQITWTARVTEDEREQSERLMLMDNWQDGRCAVCGMCAPRLVHDHDHDTGLTRGYLCQRCNVKEPIGGVIFERYRWINPASICGLEFMYAQPVRRSRNTETEQEYVRAAIEAAIAEAS